MNHYETVFILNPVLSDEQTKETVLKYEKFLTSKGAKFISKEDWGLKKLAYPIQNKKSGFYHLFEYTVDPNIISDLELEFRRDERFMRYLTVKLDKHAVDWAEKRGLNSRAPRDHDHRARRCQERASPGAGGHRGQKPAMVV